MLNVARTVVSISQGYSFMDQYSGFILRRIGEQYFIRAIFKTHESDYESPIPREEFDRIWKQTNGKSFNLLRYTIAYSGFDIELDVFFGPSVPSALRTDKNPNLSEWAKELKNYGFLVLLRLEDQMILPSWAEGAIDVTDDPNYKERCIAEKQAI